MKRALVLILAALLGAAAPARAAPWTDYRVIMWQDQTPEAYRALAAIGVDAAAVSWRNVGTEKLDRALAPLRAAGLGWYFENVATDFYASYHRWTPGKPVNWRFLETKRRYKANPDDPTVFYREPGLNDPAWLARIRARLTRAARAAAPYPPLFYNLADEAGIADNGSYWDFDLAPRSLAGMRTWLRGQYGSLAALNREWGTDFARWDEVMPETTPQAFARTDSNFAAWADFKAWMDVAFARAVRTGTEALHAADPEARSALEGGQVPGWGGYDYTRLAGAVDVFEIYDFAQNIDIVRSLSPETVLLSTSGGIGPPAAHQAWNLLLRGERGIILWDPKHRLMQPDGAPGPGTDAAAALFARLRGGIGALIAGASPHYDPVAILYSPPSFRAQWMLDVKPTGAAWSARTPDSEYEDNPVRAARRGYFQALRRLGIAPRFISPAQLAGGILDRRKDRMVVLPHAIALSEDEAQAVRRFAEAGGIVVADTIPGAFDAHVKKRTAPALARLFGSGRTNVRLVAPEPAALADALPPLLASAGIAPAVTVRGADGARPADVQSYAYRNGDVTVIAVQRERRKGAPAEEIVTLDVPKGAYVTDLMQGRRLGQTDRVTVTLGAVAPAIYAVSARPLPPLEMSLADGADATLHLGRASPVARLRPIHVAVTGPDGRAVPALTGNVLLTGMATDRPVAPGQDAPQGTWRVRVTDLLAGTTRSFALEVPATRREPRD